MKYFLDTEFIEGFHKPLFGKRHHFIDLISIGIVAEDGREYSAISNEYSYKDASEWVRENVIIPLYIATVHGDNRNHFSAENFHLHYGKSRERIAKEIQAFEANGISMGIPVAEQRPEFYAYYADYDWVVFCALFGTMMDLPTGFPMYCRDLKQMLDERAEVRIPEYQKMYIGEKVDMDWALNRIKFLSGYPKPTDEHNALSDARWNRDLAAFIDVLS